MAETIGVDTYRKIAERLDVLRKEPERLNVKSPKKKEQAAKLKEALEWYGKGKIERPIYFWKPNLPQSALCYKLNKDGHLPRIFMLEGSNKSGKSTFGIAWQIAMGVGFIPWLDQPLHFYMGEDWRLQEEIVRFCGYKDLEEIKAKFFNLKAVCPKLKVPNESLAVGETFTESVDKDMVPKYLTFIPENWKPETKKNQQGVINKIILKAGPGKGSIFHFRSYKSQADEFEGIDVSGSILFNEPPPQPVVTAVLRGALPFDTRCMFVYTALKEPWIYRDYVNKANRWLI